LQMKLLRFKAVDLYDTYLIEPDHQVKLEEFNQIVFTSPSTVDAFFKLYSTIPEGVKVVHLGRITEAAYLARLGSQGF
jgi:uroporphyrinogen-III synthase